MSYTISQKQKRAFKSKNKRSLFYIKYSVALTLLFICWKRPESRVIYVDNYMIKYQSTTNEKYNAEHTLQIELSTLSIIFSHKPETKSKDYVT